MALTRLPGFTLDSTSSVTFANVTATGNATASNANLGNLVVANYFSGNGSLLTGITATSASNANYAAYAGNVTIAAQPNITSLGTLTSLAVTGLVTAGNVKTTNIQDHTGTITIETKYNNQAGDVGITGNLVVGIGGIGNATATYFIGNGAYLTGLPASYSNANVALYLPTYTGNFTAGNATISGSLSAGSLTTSGTGGNITGANYVVANYFVGNGSSLTHIIAGNIDGQVANSLIAGTVYTNAQPNITSVGTLTSLSVTGNVTAGNLSTTGTLSTTDALVTGNLVVNGTTITANVTTINVKDPIIEMGGNTSGEALTSNDGKDRGTLLHYYSGSAIDAFMGWDNSNGEFAFGSNVTLSSEVATFNQFGNVRAGYFIGDGSLLTGLPASYSNANVASYLPTYTGNLTAGNANVSGTLSVGTLTTSGAGGNISGANYVTANYFIGDGSLLTGLPSSSSYSNSNVALYLPTYTGNVTANYFIGNGSFLSHIISSNIVGQVANSLIAGTVYTNAQPNITSLGTLTGLTVTGLVTATAGGIRVGNIKDPSGTNTIQLVNGNILVTGDILAGQGGSGNVSATYFVGNGAFLTGLPASSSYSNSNVALYLPTYTGNLSPANLVVSTSANLGSAANVKITGGSTGQYLKTDGTGNLSWETVTGGGGTGTGITYTAAATPPGSANVADQWYNTTTNTLYEYMNDGSASYWVDIQGPTLATSAPTSGYVNRSYSADGTTNIFTVTMGCGVNNILVFLNGICQMPSTDYSIIGTNLSFDVVPDSGTLIQIRELPR